MKTYLVLEDGEIFKGSTLHQQTPFPEKAGEIVFNTSHSGYEEIATDPSYFSQIVVMTAPMMGNYGVDQSNWESKKIWIQGFVCLQMQNTKRESAWADCLVQNQVPVLTEVNTRKLVFKLRSQGTPWGALVQAETEQLAKEKAFSLIKNQKNIETDWVYLSSRSSIEDRVGSSPKGPRVAVLDFGAKETILRELVARCSAIRIFPSRTSFSEIESWHPDSLMLTNGPGDPMAVQVAVETVKYFIGRLPIFGICMGHQILSLALSAQTYKLKFGHRGVNHPIQDQLLHRIYMSSQNHGYAVEETTLPDRAVVTHRNLNDGTVAGFFLEQSHLLGIQYHPESHPGPHEASQLFDFFIQNMHTKNKASSQGLLRLKTEGNLC